MNRDYNEALSEDKAVVKLAEGPYEGSKVLQVGPWLQVSGLGFAKRPCEGSLKNSIAGDWVLGCLFSARQVPRTPCAMLPLPLVAQNLCSM